MKAMLIGAAFVLLMANAAHANGNDDGSAALAALNAGNYDGAVTLFTRALDSGDLSRDDREFALASRGRAYAKEGQASLAIADLDQARRMKPDDADAQNDLAALLAARYPREAIPGMPKPSFWQSVGKSLLEGAAAGIVAGLAGQ